MARMMCRCGEVLSTVQAPNDIQLRMYTDREWDKIIADDTIHPWLIPHPKYDVWRCPRCKRLNFFADGSNKPEVVYVIEDEAPKDGVSGG